MTVKYPVAKPSLAGNELEYVTNAINDGWISSQGAYVGRLEREFAAYNGMNHGVACASGTAALTLALRALGIGPGDEVLVPEFTMIACAWAVTHVGATPVFVDCGDDLNIDVSAIEGRITARTKVIMPVHIYGRRCDMDEIMRLAFDYNIRVVEDSAEAHGIRPTADIACFSFDATKIMAAGEGGICLTDDPRLAGQLAHLHSWAYSRDFRFLHKKLGFNFRMTNLQAAVALAQLERLDEMLERRAEIQRRYDEGLAGTPGLTLMPPRDVLWTYDVRAGRLAELRSFLAGDGIETRPFFQPMSRQPPYFAPEWSALNAAGFAVDGLLLPTYVDLAVSEQEYIIGRIREFYRAG
ncbi:DegT/DnrJ/EryC1/StrS family aminotransferase [Amycolatopsis cihanbeyliensis]|uniref:dTDP-4-amino-4,6-dideoxygalactose transaminase n=1 Tax=Amycolatopsis cihanbeyliensis TaxID=1128664 RepID=A0A542CS57_AMYCI|nr:DegT/DnrJ/EryC1/StrS family aminotransferase [Amycolatopsis cihanbeyliensis]TQI93661.1 dTDP-4-amino-4,6-dideoxygalactose transaminase [Amycolatopsis cihanbeyliensis]